MAEHQGKVPAQKSNPDVQQNINDLADSAGSVQFKDNRLGSLSQLQDQANDSPQANKTAQLQAMANQFTSQQFQPIQKKKNNTGLPDNLKSGIESLSGHSMDDVKVHYNSDKPAQLNAHAYAQGSTIHLGSGQEKHLPHEAWHVVQQKQGRVKPTMQMKGKVNINDDAGLEKEADLMGAMAISIGRVESKNNIQRKVGHSSIDKSTLQQQSKENGTPMTSNQQVKHINNSNQTVVQRNINSSVFETSATPANYMVNPSARGILYTTTAAPPPLPIGLYAVGSDNDDNQGGAEMKTYVPNVRIFSIKYIAGNYVYTGANGEQEEIGTDEVLAKIEGFKDEIKDRDEEEGVITPTIGMLGINDCRIFAISLYNLIARTKYELDGGVSALQQTVQNLTEDYPEMEIGDMMKHVFDGVDCSWHAATIVAKHGSALITLEAHVSKSLESPEFHIRGGAGRAGAFDLEKDHSARTVGEDVSGTEAFVTDNNRGTNDTDTLETTKYVSGKPLEDDMHVFEQDAGNLMNSVGSIRKIEYYKNLIDAVVTDILTGPGSNAFWKTKTLLSFTDAIPDGIEAMINAIGGGVSHIVAMGGARFGAKKPLTRDPDTHAFYNLCRYYNTLLPDTGTAVQFMEVLEEFKNFRTKF